MSSWVWHAVPEIVRKGHRDAKVRQLVCFQMASCHTTTSHHKMCLHQKGLVVNVWIEKHLFGIRDVTSDPALQRPCGGSGRRHGVALAAGALAEHLSRQQITLQDPLSEGARRSTANIVHLERVETVVEDLTLIAAPPVESPLGFTRGVIDEADVAPSVRSHVELREREMAPLLYTGWGACQYIFEALAI